MKCGTTSLRNILSHHPNIFMPDHEIFYFDLDDIHQHPHFFVRHRGEWRYHDVDRQPESYFAWYASFFTGASRDQIVGENSTSYLASTKAPARIAQTIPNAKLIVMLRDPVDRAYSHYWHLVRGGRATASFENTLLFHNSSIIERSSYRRQVERLFDVTPRAQVHFILFEAFIANMESVVAETLRFLGVSTDLDLTGINTRRNVGSYPRNARLELLRNRLLGRYALKLPSHLPDIGVPRPELRGARALLSELLRRANPRQRAKPPAMRTGTRRFLHDYFALENLGLGDLIGQDVNRFWWKN